MFEVYNLGTTEFEARTQTGMTVLVSEDDVSLVCQSLGNTHASQVSWTAGDSMFFIEELGNGGFKFDQNLYISTQHTGTVVSWGKFLGRLNRCILHLLVSKIV